jgi:chemotaxis methyl-accepting protein methylase
MHHAPPGSSTSVRYVRKALRMTWNVLTLSDTARLYPARVRQLLGHWLFLRHRNSRLAVICGRFVQRRNRARQTRRPDSGHTYFLRNMAQFEVLRDIALDWPATDVLRFASIGCSTGAEVYSALWMIRRARPELRIRAVGADISPSAIRTARSGRYARTDREVQRLGPDQIESLFRGRLFEADGDTLAVQPWVAGGARWLEASVLDPALVDQLGPQDVVFVNNILCHFPDPEAKAGLVNITRLLVPGGYLFISGVDLDVKTRVTQAAGLVPVRARLEELYEGDAQALRRWPATYWGPEPLDRTRRDWVIRYATLFRAAEHSG